LARRDALALPPNPIPEVCREWHERDPSANEARQESPALPARVRGRTDPAHRPEHEM